MKIDDTITAISSAIGPAARIVVRLSGKRSHELVNQFIDTAIKAPAATRLGLRAPRELSAGLTVPAWVYSFAAPRSYTGEDSVELHLPGNPLLARMYVSELIALGARHAEPGEFTARAFLNGRLDLAEAEGVAMTIAATNDAELRASRQLLSGELAKRLRPLMTAIIETLSLVEAGIDFAEEDISFIAADQIETRIATVIASLNELAAGAARFERLTHEPRFALIGRPNAGKSTLLNALAGHERAVVSHIAGTTRDLLSATVALDRGLVTVIDAAGVEAVEHDPNGVNAQMQLRTRRAIEEAEFVIEVIDATTANSRIISARKPDLVILNKCDLLPRGTGFQPVIDQKEHGLEAHATKTDHLLIQLSGSSRFGFAELKLAMSKLAFGEQIAGATLALNSRHLAAMDEAQKCLANVITLARSNAGELIALELRHALDSLGTILGQVSPDDILGHIFGSFCIGK